MSRISLSDRVSVSAQQRLSRMLVAGGTRMHKLGEGSNATRAAPALRAAGRELISTGQYVGRRSRARRKEVKRLADAARDDADGTGKPPDLRPVIAEHNDAETARARKALARLAARDDPVLVGPFLGEVGFELLYWVPFVHWARREFPELHGRLIVASRGGTRAWYGKGTQGYADALDVFSPEEFVERRLGFKQRKPTPLDREFATAIGERLGLRNLQHLHPSLMWHGYYQAIKSDERSYARAVRGVAPGVSNPLLGFRSVYRPIVAPPIGDLEQVLPHDFVAARFYFRSSFPDTPANRAFAASVLSRLAERIPVVLLNNRLELDEHTDLDLDSPGIVTLADHMTPATNLHVQTVAVSRARAFVGTYGGLSYLAPYLGVPSMAFVEDGLEQRPWHFDLAQQIFRAPPWGSLALLTTRDAGMLELLTGLRSSPVRAPRAAVAAH